MSGSVASVTVTYNAVQVLPRQIEALLRQTHPLREIVVVDNASSDGTGTMLAELYPQVTVLRMPENLGAAGGWAAGLSYAAIEKGYDWVWTFDQDSVPESNALANLLAEGYELDGVTHKIGMLVPMPFHRETGRQYPPILWRDGFLKPGAQRMSEPVWFADIAIASGSLVRKEVVCEIGVPRADFFMDICDFEYCLRIRSRGYKIAVINHAEISHEIGNSRNINLPFYKRFWMNQPPWREYYIGRNLTYLAWRLYPNLATKISIARYLAVHVAGVLLFSSNGAACVIRMTQGFWDGLRGRLGVRFLPSPRHSQIG